MGKLVQSTLDNFFTSATKKPKLEEEDLPPASPMSACSDEAEMCGRSPIPATFDLSDPSKCKTDQQIRLCRD